MMPKRCIKPVNAELYDEVERLGRVIGALKVATTGIAAAIDCHDHLDSSQVASLFSLILCELIDTHQNLSEIA